jgi:hypothetical protein
MLPPTTLCYHGKDYTELLPSNDRRVYRQTYRHMWATVLLLLCVFVAMFSELLPSKRRDTHSVTQTEERDL